MLALAACAAAPAGAAEPVYFHQSGIARERFATDLAECVDLAEGVQAPRHFVYSPNLYAAAAGAFFAGLLGSGEKRKMIDSVLRTCMADKGYSRIKATGPLRKELGALSKDARLDRLYQLAAADAPLGKALPK